VSRCLPVSGPSLAAVRSTHSRSSADRYLCTSTTTSLNPYNLARNR
jgi:hypothetical protein